MTEPHEACELVSLRDRGGFETRLSWRLLTTIVGALVGLPAICAGIVGWFLR